MKYSAAIALQRLAAVRNSLRSGAIELLAIDGSLLASLRIASPSIDPEARELSWQVEPGRGRATGDVAMARVRSDDGGVAIDELSVAETGDPGDVQIASLRVLSGQTIDGVAFTVRHP